MGVSDRPTRVVIAALDPRHHGGIIGVLATWRATGFGERVELIELPTSGWDDPCPRQALTARIEQLYREVAAG